MNELKLYTDGGCSGNPGPGGYGFAVIENDRIVFSDAQFSTLTTNNKMELSAVIHGLSYIRSTYFSVQTVIVHTDSSYTMNAMLDWVHNWRKNDWKKSNGKPIENPELIKELYALCYESPFSVSFKKVKAHQKKTSKDYDPFNDYVDQLATGKTKPTRD